MALLAQRVSSPPCPSPVLFAFQHASCMLPAKEQRWHCWGWLLPLSAELLVQRGAEQPAGAPGCHPLLQQQRLLLAWMGPSRTRRAAAAAAAAAPAAPPPWLRRGAALPVVPRGGHGACARQPPGTALGGCGCGQRRVLRAFGRSPTLLASLRASLPQAEQSRVAQPSLAGRCSVYLCVPPPGSFRDAAVRFALGKPSVGHRVVNVASPGGDRRPTATPPTLCCHSKRSH